MREAGVERESAQLGQEGVAVFNVRWGRDLPAFVFNNDLFWHVSIEKRGVLLGSPR